MRPGSPRPETAPRKRQVGVLVDAHPLEPGAQGRRLGPSLDFSYSVIDPEAPSRPAGERRGALRQRTRLRSGKLTGPDGRFIVECLIHNRSQTGCRLRLPVMANIPNAFYLFDDRTGSLSYATVAWRRERDLGLRLKPCPASPAHRALADRMRRKFYALPA